MNLPLRHYWNLLRVYLAAQRRRVALLALLLFGGIALQLVNPQVLRFFIDTAQSGCALDTLLTAGGETLSAGEAQLLAFTRVLLKDPGLVILDEASSRLDPATERRIERAVAQLLHGRTGIIIAHKLATVGRVDEIMVLEAGRIVEHGKRVDLVADPESRFAGLLRTGLEEALA
jgi:ABC-type bacteriocin/lantibiotic exporter with double-glycine peptidase domain